MLKNITNKISRNIIYKKKVNFLSIILGFIILNFLPFFFLYYELYKLALFFLIIIVLTLYIETLFMPHIEFYKSFLHIKYPTRIYRKNISIYFKDIISIKTSKGIYSKGDIKIKYYYRNRIKKRYLKLNLKNIDYVSINSICEYIDKNKILAVPISQDF